MVIAVTINGDKELIRTLRGFKRKIPEANKRGLWLASNRLAMRLRESAPKGATGYMKSSKGTYARKLRDNQYAIMMPYYVDYVERRITRSRGIPPRRKVLWWQEYTGAYIVGLKTTKAHLFTARTIKNTLPEMRKIIEKEIRRTTR